MTGPAAGLQQATDLLVVDQVLPEGVRLRRKGQAAGVGMPPGPASGLTGVAFLVTTFAPQIETATEEVNRRCGIMPPQNGQASLDPGDRRELCEATVLTVLHARYLDLAQDENGILAFKARVFKRSSTGCSRRSRSTATTRSRTTAPRGPRSAPDSSGDPSSGERVCLRIVTATPSRRS